MISEPRMGRITQGTIFCGGYAEDYSGLPVWGLIITARCDTTHEKTPIVNYLPVVKIEDWLFGHGGILSIDRETAEVSNRFKNLLAKRQLSGSLLDVHPPDEIAKLHFSMPAQLGNQKAQKEARDAEVAIETASHLNRLQHCLASPLPNRDAVQAALTGCRKSVETVVKDLITHKLAGYYFLPTLGGADGDAFHERLCGAPSRSTPRSTAGSVTTGQRYFTGRCGGHTDAGPMFRLFRFCLSRGGTYFAVDRTSDAVVLQPVWSHWISRY